jgi:hypothetical protein
MLPMLVRMPCGGTQDRFTHNQWGWFNQNPGLKVVYPAFPYDAKGVEWGYKWSKSSVVLSTSNCTEAFTKTFLKIITRYH